jgi:hypothetical protein
MIDTEDHPRPTPHSSGTTRNEGLTTVGSDRQDKAEQLRRKALKQPGNFPNSPRLVRWWDTRSLNWLPGLEVIILLIAILMMSIALPLQAGLIPLGTDEPHSETPIE